MYNDINIGPFTIHMYGIMVAIGFVAAYLISDYRAKKKNLSSDIIFGLLWCSIIGGALGARLLFYLVSIPDIMENPSILWDLSNGFVVYGGILGGVLVSFLYCRIKKVEFVKYFDLVLPEVALAQGFGRIGCFFAGCCYGRETHSSLGIMYHHSELAPNNVNLIPTQLISSAGDFIIAAVLFIYARKKRKNAQVGALYMILYSVGRFLVEFLRNDNRGSVGALSTSQFIAILICIAGIAIMVLAKKKGFGKEE